MPSRSCSTPRTPTSSSSPDVRRTRPRSCRASHDVILLSAPRETLLRRLAIRPDNPFGKDPGELERILHDLDTIEPLLRSVANHEIRTTGSVDEALSSILGLVETGEVTR